MNQTDTLPEGFRIECKRENQGFGFREYFFLYDPKGTELVRKEKTFTDGDYIEKVMRQLARLHDAAQKELDRGDNAGLRRATGYQKFKSLVGTTVVESDGIMDSPFQEPDHFTIKFSNGLVLSFDDMQHSEGYILNLTLG